MGEVEPDIGRIVNTFTATHPERHVDPARVYQFEVCDKGGGCSPDVTETSESDQVGPFKNQRVTTRPSIK